MDKLPIRVTTLDEIRQSGDNDRYWESQTVEARLSAVEILRRQYGKLPPGKGYGSSQRLRRILRIVQRASGRPQDLIDLDALTKG